MIHHVLTKNRIVCTIFIAILFMGHLVGASVFTPDDVLKIKSISDVAISPDGKWVAYTVSVPREATDKAGSAYKELYIASTQKEGQRPFITGKVRISSPKWSPDGKQLAFLTKRGDDANTQVWTIPMDGGEARAITKSESSVSYFQWSPDGAYIAYLATTPKSKREQQLEKKGYDFVYFEENLKHRNLYRIAVDEPEADAEQLSSDMTLWDFKFSSDGKTIAASSSPKNLIDHKYMFRKIYLLSLGKKIWRPLTNNPGKLGMYAFSPDNTKLAYTAALELKDHQVSQVYVIDVAGGNATNLTPPNFRGHVNWVGWKYNSTIIYRSGEGVHPTLSEIKVKDNAAKRKVVLHSEKLDISFGTPSVTANCRHLAFEGSSPTIPSDVYYWRSGKSPKRLTNINPWIAERTLGKQEIIHYNARDEQQIEGLLIYPTDYQESQKYPLIVFVHGGPEHHHSQEWMTTYSRPAQVLAGQGFTILYINYRASTGYGVDFALAGYEDPAGKEFDDIADGIDYLIKEGIADKDRVGLAGGSYGGYAAAWFSSYYTKYVKAVCMFVGISDLISKRGTTDIPYEEWYVHSGKPLEQMWDLALKRSPIYYAHQSKTAVLIYGGTADTRVHPAQSMEYYWRLKVNEHPAVRLVQYPGEGHGNSKQPGRIDVLHRTLDWLNWYVKDTKPLDGPMPALDISDKYGLELKK